MRGKILVDVGRAKEVSIYDAIAGKGNFERFNLNDNELLFLSECGYFRQMSFKYGLSIELYEEQVICDKYILQNLKVDTSNYKIMFGESEFNRAFDILIEALEVSLRLNSCVYFIL